MNGFKENRKRQILVCTCKILLIFPVFTGWIGILYPDLTFQKGVCRAYTATGQERSELSGEACYEELLQAEPKQIRVKSRLLEFFLSFEDEKGK